MIESSPFTTRARTIDHLGREQIADCPTAVSELWKNSYDAYARNVSLDIYDGEQTVVTISDDGHGMSLQEVREKWLVVGTESKTSKYDTSEEDRNGLNPRPKQGQKGIGRLSSAYLGSVLLLVSKRKEHDFAVLLIDWRIFQNPFLLLQDIRIPIASFKTAKEILPALDEMRDRLMGNIWGDNDDQSRSLRIQEAWSRFEEQERSEERATASDFKTIKEQLEETIISTSFDARHFSEFQIWNNLYASGTALLISDTDDSVENLLHSRSDSISSQTRKNFVETLTGFADPYVKKIKQEEESALEFNFSASCWHGDNKETIVGTTHDFTLESLLHLEHIIDGTVDEHGVFKGRVKAFGNWHEGEVTIDLEEKSILGRRIDTRLGPFKIFVATAEWEPQSTTHTKEELANIQSLAKLYSGFMLYRDGLRVMPYGRSDNDFFEIERRRSLHAGRHFWNHRRMFGKVAISKFENPNLRDKAGREGVVDNRAAKTLKDIVIHVLDQSARRFFGTNSELRKETLPQIQEAYREAKLAEENKKLKRKQLREFKGKLKKFLPILQEDFDTLKSLEDEVGDPAELIDEERVHAYRERLQEVRSNIKAYTLGTAPKKLGTKADDYLDFRDIKSRSLTLSTQLAQALSEALERINPKSAKDVAYSDLQRQAHFLHQRTRNWKKQIEVLLETESVRIGSFIDERNKKLHEEYLPVLDDLENRRTDLSKVLLDLEARREELDSENEDVLVPYISTLECLQERIDLSGVANAAAAEAAELLSELNNLNELAQLGITVELVGHELETFDTTIGDGLSKLPEKIKESRAYSQIKDSYEGLSDRLRFLSPLKLSGERNRAWISGQEIHDYVSDFFRNNLDEYEISLTPTPEFLNFKVYDLPSRILPVFLNLTNNSIYWVNQNEPPKKITLAISNESVVIGDSGPGISEADIPRLFTLFFSKKIRGGRGVGLYLCRTNLAASGHRIDYLTNEELKVEEGANFSISFKGALYEND